MRRQIAMLSIIGLLGSFTSAQAAAPAGGRFDGIYQLVSSAKVSETFVTRQGIFGECPDRAPGLLKIERDRVEYVAATGRHFEGTVTSEGQLLMDPIQQPNTDGKTFEMNVTGSVDSTGTAYGRQLGNSCTYDFIWRKQQ